MTDLNIYIVTFHPAVAPWDEIPPSGCYRAYTATEAEARALCLTDNPDATIAKVARIGVVSPSGYD